MALSIAALIAALLVTGCNRKASSTIEQLAFEGEEVRVRYKRTDYYDYFPDILCMHGCGPDVVESEIRDAWHPFAPAEGWRLSDVITAPIEGEIAVNPRVSNSGLFLWRTSDKRCPGFYGTQDVPEVVDCEASSFHMASRDGRFTLWNARLTGPWRGEDMDWRHLLLIEADATVRRSIDLFPERERELKGESCRAVLDAVGIESAGRTTFDDEVFLSHDGRYLLIVFRPDEDNGLGQAAWWVQRRELATGMQSCAPVDVPVEWSSSQLVEADVRDGRLEMIWLRNVGTLDAPRHRLRHWREGGKAHELDVAGARLAWDVPTSRLLVAGPELHLGPPGGPPHVFTIELHDLGGDSTPPLRWMFQPPG